MSKILPKASMVCFPSQRHARPSLAIFTPPPSSIRIDGGLRRPIVYWPAKKVATSSWTLSGSAALQP
eukprot:6528090-Alexandrium_andersonii.AAC.1